MGAGRVAVLGLDPGLLHTGFGAVARSRDGTPELVEAGTLSPPADLSLALRLAFLFDEIQVVLARTAPEAVAVEETVVNRNPRTSLHLGMARGICLLAAARLEPCSYAATEVKRAITGNGKADKAQVAACVRLVLPSARGATAAGGAGGATTEKPLDEHALDALAVALCHLQGLPLREALAAHAASAVAGGHAAKS